MAAVVPITHKTRTPSLKGVFRKHMQVSASKILRLLLESSLHYRKIATWKARDVMKVITNYSPVPVKDRSITYKNDKTMCV